MDTNHEAGKWVVFTRGPQWQHGDAWYVPAVETVDGRTARFRLERYHQPPGALIPVLDRYGDWTELFSTDRHECRRSLHCGYFRAGTAVNRCREHDDGTLTVDNDEYETQVSFCPFCGFKARIPAPPDPGHDGQDCVDACKE